MEPVTTAALIGAGSSMLNTGGGLIQTGMSNKFAAKQARLAYKRNIKMWNLQNEYNTPSAQMERFKQAGLNPNLIYGQGNAGNAGPGPTYDPPKYEGPNPIPDFTGMSQTYLNAKQLEAGIEQVHANTELTKARVNTEFINQSLKALGRDKLSFDINKLQALLPYQLEIQKNKADASQYDVQTNVSNLMTMNLKRQTELLNQDYMRKRMTAQDIENDIKRARLVYDKYTNQLRKAGLTERDGVLTRLLGQAFDNTPGATKGTTLNDWAFNFSKWLDQVLPQKYGSSPTKKKVGLKLNTSNYYH